MNRNEVFRGLSGWNAPDIHVLHADGSYTKLTGFGYRDFKSRL